jgi:ABC-type amino acid transport substrate-binding protein
LSGIGILLALAASVPAAAPSDRPPGRLRADGVLRVLLVPNEKEPEFYCLRSDCPPGFDREVLEGFAAAHRLKLEAVPLGGWDQLIPALTARRGDVIAGRFTHTEARARQVAFTSEVFPTRHVVVTHRARRPPIQSLEELRRERVGTIPGSSMAEVLAEAGVPAARTDASYTTATILDGLSSGKVGAVVLGIERAILLARRMPEIEIGIPVGSAGRLAFAVRTDDVDLLRALDEYLAAHRRSGKWSQLLIKYFGPTAPEVLRKARADESAGSGRQ